MRHAVLALTLVLTLWHLARPAQAADLPDAVAKRIAAAPDQFIEFASDLIHGFGREGAVDAAGIEVHLALQRAGVRASALRRMFAADLDGDGAVARAELEVLAAATSARGRGRLWRMFEAADSDRDGRAAPPEIVAWAAADTLRLITAADEADARAVLSFDRNADGRVTVEDVRTGVAVLAGAT